jgi:hypothetical protein
MSGTDADELVRVVQGNPSPEELAALIAVLTARITATATSPLPAARSEWGSPARYVRSTHRHGAGAWRSSAWPR